MRCRRVINIQPEARYQSQLIMTTYTRRTRREARISLTGDTSSRPRSGAEGGGEGSGVRLLAMASALIVPSAFISSIASASCAAGFVPAPAASLFYGRCTNTQHVSFNTTRVKCETLFASDIEEGGVSVLQCWSRFTVTVLTGCLVTCCSLMGDGSSLASRHEEHGACFLLDRATRSRHVTVELEFVRVRCLLCKYFQN